MQYFERLLTPLDAMQNKESIENPLKTAFYGK
jgi:hypothetical protein